MKEIIKDENELTAETEISLVDILAILLRWRRLILSLTLGSLIVVLGYVLLLQYGFIAQENNSLQHAQASFRINTSILSLASSKEYNLFLTYALSEPTVIDTALRKANITTLDGIELGGLDAAERIFLVREYLINGKDTSGKDLGAERWIYRSNAKGESLQLDFRHVAGDKALGFLKALKETLEERCFEQFKPGVISFMQGFEDIKSKPTQSAIDSGILVNGYKKYSSASDFMEGRLPLLVNLGQAELIEMSDSEFTGNNEIGKKGFIFIVAVFLASLMLSFLAEGIRLMLNDPLSRVKLGLDDDLQRYDRSDKTEILID
ncbi:MAG TPA: hypothetical protein DCG47_11050 [Spirochaetaceae bacterium]|nr:hypothetical protein [Spirochaetaceae bacterium]